MFRLQKNHKLAVNSNKVSLRLCLKRDIIDLFILKIDIFERLDA